MPQAIRWVWPMTTPGTPAKLKPDTSKGQAGDRVWQCRPTWYQIPGRLGARCGSFASSGLPVVVSAPETTHEFEPTPSMPPPSRSGTPATACRVVSSTSWPAADVRAARTPVGSFAAVVAFAAVVVLAPAARRGRGVPLSRSTPDTAPDPVAVVPVPVFGVAVGTIGACR